MIVLSVRKILVHMLLSMCKARLHRKLCMLFMDNLGVMATTRTIVMV